MKSCLVLDLLPPALQLAAGLGVPNARQQRLNRNKTVLKRRSSRQHASLRLLRTSVAGAAGAGAGTAPTSFSAAAKALEARLRQCVDAEAEEQQAQLERAYARSSEKTLIREGVVLAGLKGNAEGRLYGDMVWSFQPARAAGGDLPPHKFKGGSSVTLKVSRGGNKKLGAIEGTVVDVHPIYVRVALGSQAALQLGEAQAQGDMEFRMELGAQDVTSRRQFAALERLSTLVTQERDGEKRVRAILLGSPKGAQLAAMPPEWMQQRSWQAAAAQALKQLRTVNDSQRAAIAAGLVRSLTLWQGPPGTGKTRTILEFLALLCGMAGASNERRQQIGVALAVADTNAAADNLLEGLLARGLSVTRVGQPAKVRPELRHTCLDAMAENTPAGKSAAALRDQAATLLVRSEDAIRSGRLSPQEAAQVQRDAQRMWAQADKILAEAAGGVLQRCQVVVCTCAAAGEARLAEVAFRVVVVDEATQATEPSTLIALVKGAECVIMAGDHKQLPPTVISRKAVELGMDVPLFARLQRGGVPALLLNRQYRMHPAIAAFPSAQFYEGKVLSGVAAHERPALCGFQWKAPSLPVAFVHCSGPEDRARSGALSSIQDDSGSSYSNKAQAEIVVDVAAGFLKDPTVTSCVILTPYNGQVRLLNTLCKPRFGQLLESGKLIISTVDGFQGREGDAVVFSTVRCNPDAKLGFVADARRMNVALTRARRGVVVVGCGHTLGSGSQHWREWLSWLGGQQTTHVE